MNIRKIVNVKETIHSDAMGMPCEPICRVAAMAIVTNPLSGISERNLSVLFEIGAELGERLAKVLVSELPGPPVSYGKAALVGVGGEMEHGGALIHPRLGAPMRLASNGGEAVIPSNVKMAVPGTAIDLPLGHKDNPWSFDHFDTMTLMVADAPLPGEIVMCLAYADAGRASPRCGPGPVSV
jgi:hypothetical protein